jgi:hypothetical protein
MAAGHFTVKTNAQVRLRPELKRLADLAQEGWWPGDLHVHRPRWWTMDREQVHVDRLIAEVELIMRAEDLHIAPVLTWWNNRSLWERWPLPADPLVRFDDNRYCHLMAGEDERQGGALLFFNLPRPLPIAGSTREYPSPMEFVSLARRQPDAWIEIEVPWWYDVPVWLASGQANSIELAHNHMCRDREKEREIWDTEVWGKPRDDRRLPPPLGNGYWSQEIYYHILNAGLRLPPSAGSASGVLPNPLGYNRVYVHVDGKLDYGKWWEGLRAGHCFVTNGPLLRVNANKQLPGHVFTAPEGQAIDIEVKAELDGRDRVPALEIIRDGKVERRIPYEEWQQKRSLGRLQFTQSGWFLVRAITDNPRTFRFASTGPYYVEVGEARRRISRSSAQFFLDWVKERMGRIQIDGADKKRQVMAYQEMARKYWEKVVASANAD